MNYNLTEVPVPTERPVPTVDSIRREVRDAIFQTLFYSTMYKIESRSEEDELCRQRAGGFVALGMNTGLFSVEEGNDWLDAMWGRKVLADVVLKYSPE